MIQSGCLIASLSSDLFQKGFSPNIFSIRSLVCWLSLFVLRYLDVLPRIFVSNDHCSCCCANARYLWRRRYRFAFSLIHPFKCMSLSYTERSTKCFHSYTLMNGCIGTRTFSVAVRRSNYTATTRLSVSRLAFHSLFAAIVLNLDNFDQ